MVFAMFMAVVSFLIMGASCEPHSDWQIQFEKMNDVNPVLGPNASTTFRCPIRKKEVRWEEKDVFNPAAVVKDGKVYLLYRAEDTIGRFAGTSRVGIAWSDDGVHFQRRQSSPVLFPDHDRLDKYEWEGGCEDPRVVERPMSDGGGYVMTYTAYDGTARLCVASSQDLFNWEKHGPAFGKASGGVYKNAWTKSGSIVVQPQLDGRLVAAKLNGTYWMYWGENHIHAATSPDLINWTPVMSNEPSAAYRGRPDHLDHPTEALKPLSILKPRRGYFDSNLVEPGPPAIARPDGILFIYNSKNAYCDHHPGGVCADGEADPDLAPGTYSAGQVLFSLEDPTRVVKRSEKTFFKPTEDFEITGQVGNVCFLEGLVFFKNKWFLYYGTADSKIAVAEASLYDYRGMVDQKALDRLAAARGKYRSIVFDTDQNEGEVFSRGSRGVEVAGRQRGRRGGPSDGGGGAREVAAAVEAVLEAESGDKESKNRTLIALVCVAFSLAAIYLVVSMFKKSRLLVASVQKCSKKLWPTAKLEGVVASDDKLNSLSHNAGLGCDVSCQTGSQHEVGYKWEV